MGHAKTWFEQAVGPYQGAALSGCSSLHSTMFLREIMSYVLEGSSDAYVVLLDTKQAFDTVWNEGLFYQLFKCKIDYKLWFILRNYYIGFKCLVNISGVQSFWFDIKQGVHQGEVFSNRLYQVFIHSLFTELSSDGIPVWMYGIQCHYILSADDLALISLFVAHMQHNLSIVVRYSRKWRYRHKTCKSLFLAQRRTTNKNAFVYLGEDQIIVYVSLVYTLKYQYVTTPNG